MRIEIACFSARGQALGERLAAALTDAATAVTRCGGDGPGLGHWTATHFPVAHALVFVGAAGIAVRAVAPHLRSKASDPAVVAVDETGRFAVPLLSGHMGGANALAERLAGILGATAAVTTATECRGVFAIDRWAAENGLAIRNPGAIKRVSARLLDGLTVGLRTPYRVAGPLPEGIVEEAEWPDVVVDVRTPADEAPLHIVPPIAILGVGCRKGTAAAALEAALNRLFRENRLAPEAVGCVCSIDLKKDEPGLLEFCRTRRLPFVTFGAGELAAVGGDFAASPFVEKVTGVDNVCERSAMAGGGAHLLLGKVAMDGITMAVSIRDFLVEFTPGEAER